MRVTIEFLDSNRENEYYSGIEAISEEGSFVVLTRNDNTWRILSSLIREIYTTKED